MAIGDWVVESQAATTSEIVAIKSASNGKYVCAEDGGNKALIANRTGVGAWEEFEIICLGV